ncbi:MAG: DUF805 domain-containing protein [Burkholderiales bacterium]
MTFTDSIITCLKKYSDFSGRASRSEYWWFTLFCVVAPSGLGLINEILGALSFFALLLPQITASARRLHDVGKTGWLLLVGIIPIVGQLVVLYWCVLASSNEANEFGPPTSSAAT